MSTHSAQIENTSEQCLVCEFPITLQMFTELASEMVCELQTSAKEIWVRMMIKNEDDESKHFIKSGRSIRNDALDVMVFDASAISTSIKLNLGYVTFMLLGYITSSVEPFPMLRKSHNCNQFSIERTKCQSCTSMNTSRRFEVQSLLLMPRHSQCHTTNLQNKHVIEIIVKCTMPCVEKYISRTRHAVPEIFENDNPSIDISIVHARLLYISMTSTTHICVLCVVLCA